MNLPFILDVALGLIFIYLILSLLASEIQELLTTVLQWRAEHLRRSIEILLAGDAQNSEIPEVIQLVNKIYGNPLIKLMGYNLEDEGENICKLCIQYSGINIYSEDQNCPVPKSVSELKTYLKLKGTVS